MLNDISIMGRLTRDPEMRETAGGTKVARFNVAVERDHATVNKVDYINCTAFGSTAEFVCKHFQKGNMICVRGSMESSRWEDRDGKKRTDWYIAAWSVYFTGEKTGQRAGTEEGPTEDPGWTEEPDDGNFPF